MRSEADSLVPPPRADASAVALCLGLSGAAALAYEVLWLRQLTLVMGQTAAAVAALLTAFLGGLALGAFVGGRWADRRGATLRTFAALELGVAVTALAVPMAMEAMDPAFGALYRAASETPVLLSLGQLVLAGIVLLPSCLLMGMTLPIAVELTATPGASVHPIAGRLYAINAAGGVVGAAAAGLLLLPALGAQATNWVAVGVDGLAAAFAFAASFEARAPAMPPARPAAPQTSSTPGGWTAPPASAVIFAYGLAGLTALTLQVAWSRLVALSIGSTIYGFTITVATFIAGLALGSAASARVRTISSDPVRALFFLHLAIAAWTLVTLPLIGGLPGWILPIMERDYGFEAVLGLQGAVIFGTIFLPTAAMGAIFPSICELFRRSGRSAAGSVGTAYVANTFGNILGTLLAGFLWIPWVGMRGTLLVSAALSAIVALLFLVPSLWTARKRTVSLASVTAAAFTVIALLSPEWDDNLVTSAPFLHGYQGGMAKDASGRMVAFSHSPGELVDYEEGPTTVASVRRVPGGMKLLYSGGVYEAASRAPVHRYLAHQALLLHGSAKEILVVGLGTGNTLRGVLEHPVSSVDCVELSPEVVHLASAHFQEETGHALSDPRAHLIVGDGRGHLRHSNQTYDVIISQPSHPWASGAAGLFTQEYFLQMRARLRPDGVAAAWFPAQFDRVEHSLLAAWRASFESVYLFSPAGGSHMDFVIGFAEQTSLDPERVRRALAEPGVAAAAAAAGIRSAELLLAAQRPWPTLDPTVPINTDDNALAETESFRRMIQMRGTAAQR